MPDQPPSRTASSRRRARIALAAAAVLVALAASEAAVRLLFPQPAPIVLEDFARIVEQGHRLDFESVFRWDDDLLWRLRPGVTLPEHSRPLGGLVSSAQGLREDRLIVRPKPEGAVRVLFLGDSVTFGYRLPPELTFVRQVERELRARVPGRAIECINAGVPGYTVVQGVRWLETEGIAFEPDLVVLEFGWNCPATWPGGGDLEQLAARQRMRPPRGLAGSRLLRLAFAAAAPTPRIAGKRVRVTPEEFRAELERAQDLASRHGADLLVLVSPGRVDLEGPANAATPYQIQQYLFAREHRFASDGGAAGVDGVERFRRLTRTHSPDELFFDGVHPTALGHRALAAALIERLEPWLRTRPPGHAAPAGADARAGRSPR